MRLAAAGQAGAAARVLGLPQRSVAGQGAQMLPAQESQARARHPDARPVTAEANFACVSTPRSSVSEKSVRNFLAFLFFLFCGGVLVKHCLLHKELDSQCVPELVSTEPIAEPSSFTQGVQTRPRGRAQARPVYGGQPC